MQGGGNRNLEEVEEKEVERTDSRGDKDKGEKRGREGRRGVEKQVESRGWTETEQKGKEGVVAPGVDEQTGGAGSKVSREMWADVGPDRCAEDYWKHSAGTGPSMYGQNTTS